MNGYYGGELEENGGLKGADWHISDSTFNDVSMEEKKKQRKRTVPSHVFKKFE
ncbi:unnamed protein product [Sphenostylis stenocarpa]|uniref:Uncharacterized protein n=1 Tax=Sphenostylis stenocarpa TaxID=92480 RepID=A0AA86S8L9_9FABA|nr:unnamed protein product [Sphenostylis stenocarpa]